LLVMFQLCCIGNCKQSRGLDSCGLVGLCFAMGELDII